VLSVLIVLLLIAGGVLFAFGSNGAGAQGTVIDAINSAFSQKTAHVALTETISGVASVNVSGSGDIDFTDNAMQLQMTFHAAGQDETIQAIYLNDTIYEQVPGIDQVLPGKSWISIDLSELAKTSGSSGDLNSVGADPVATLHLLAQQGNTVTPTGSTTVDGVAVQGYDIEINPASITALLQSSSLPSWLRQAVTTVKLSNADEQVFIDGSGDLRRTTSSVDVAVGSKNVSEQGEIEYSNYGESVTIAPPPADQVATFQQLLQAAGGSLSTGEST
jgi:hypothetical protein